MPPVALLTAEMVSVSPSTSRSLDRRADAAMVRGVSSAVVALSALVNGRLLVPSAKIEMSLKARLSTPARISVPSAPETVAPPALRVTV